jgi:3-oxoacyl-(acyl-carrier-protein) synthase
MSNAPNRVVVTGVGVIAPNGHGKAAFSEALRAGKSGIRFRPELQELRFGCQVAGVPEGVGELKHQYFSEEELFAMNSNIVYAGIAAIDAWVDAGFQRPTGDSAEVDWDTGAIVGTGIAGMETIAETLVPKTLAGKVTRLGSTMVEQIMVSGNSARISGLLALGNQVSTNSAACATGTEAITMAFSRIRAGLAQRMLAGSSEGDSPFIWAGFDAMKVTNRSSNDRPEQASRPMSASAGGFVPGAGSGVLMLESLDSARGRGARIYAEVLGTALSSGGQRTGGSMTAPNPAGVQRCIRAALSQAKLLPHELDAINGHLTATMADPLEVDNWARALELPPEKMPLLHATKSMIGHTLAAAGGIESVACVLELDEGFVHPSLNCEDLHPSLVPYRARIARELVKLPELRTLAKASFGFGDVNACIIFGKFDES